MPLHHACGFKMKDDGAIKTVCGTCGKGRKRLIMETLKDTVLSSGWVTTVRKEKGITDTNQLEQEREQKIIDKCDDFNFWLATIDEIQYRKERNVSMYYGRNREQNRIRKIPSFFLKETLCEFIETSWEEINAEKPREWQPLDKYFNEFIRSHGRCYSNEMIYDNFEKCNEKEWNYIKFSSSSENPSYICDLPTAYDANNGAYISFTNNP
jgi:hypothetical protein